MPTDLKTSPPRNHTPTEDQYHVNADAIAAIQRGLLLQPTFFGNQSATAAFANFVGGVAAGQTAAIKKAIEVTSTQLGRLEQVAQSMANYGHIYNDVARDFLHILIRIDNPVDFEAVLTATGLKDVIPLSYMGKIDELLEIPALAQTAFLANALNGVLKTYARYLNAGQLSSGGSSPLNAILSAFDLGGSSVAQALLDAGAIEQRLGNFLSELVTGKRIPIPVIAQNPMKESPSYLGKVFFGELSGVMSLVDIAELFPKKVAAFPQASNGAGMSSFNFQNMAGFTNAMSMVDVVNNIAFGGKIPEVGSFMAQKADAMVGQLRGMLGAAADEMVEMRRADNAIPMMIAMSAVISGRDTSPFPASTFQDGWALASSVTQYLAKNESAFLAKMRGQEEEEETS